MARRHQLAERRKALGLTQEELAELLDVDRTTVGRWESGDTDPKPWARPRLAGALQVTVDELLAMMNGNDDGAAPTESQREPALNGDGPPPDGEALRVAIAVVVHDLEVLLVCHRGEDGRGILWQFPSGVIKPGAAAATTAVRETYDETGVRCVVRSELGSRLHPITKVFCSYFVCDYLSGAAENKDVVENVDVAWVPQSELTRYIPEEAIYPPILTTLDTGHAATHH